MGAAMIITPSLDDDLQTIIAKHNAILIAFVRPGRWNLYWINSDADRFERHGFAEAASLRQARAIAKKYAPQNSALIIVELAR